MERLFSYVDWHQCRKRIHQVDFYDKGFSNSFSRYGVYDGSHRGLLPPSSDYTFVESFTIDLSHCNQRYRSDGTELFLSCIHLLCAKSCLLSHPGHSGVRFLFELFRGLFYHFSHFQQLSYTISKATFRADVFRLIGNRRYSLRCYLI